MPEPVTQDEVDTAAEAYMQALNHGAHHVEAMRAALEAVAPATLEEIEEQMARAFRQLAEERITQRYHLVPIDPEGAA